MNRIRNGRVIVRVRMLNPDRILNILWNNDIAIANITKEDVTTLVFELDYADYSDLADVVKRCGGKVKIIETKGSLFLYLKVKRSISLVVGGILFFCLIYVLSGYVWSVEINTTKNVSPYEIRKVLYQNGVLPGIKKGVIDVNDVERIIEDNNRDVLWVRARIEGSSLRVLIEEKVNPPEIEHIENGNLIATMDGEISRVYTYSGRAVVKEGDLVSRGDILIEGIIGSEGNEVEVPPSGVVIANTFIEKSMALQTKGTVKERNGNKDADLYLKLFGKKFYLKKAIKDFQSYDKIEEEGSFVNKVTYYEKVDKEVSLTKELAIEKASIELENAVLADLRREANIVDKVVTVNEKDDSNIIVTVAFVIEQNIVDNTPIND